MIPLEQDGLEEILEEAPVDLPSPPDLIERGTTADVDLSSGTKYAEQAARLKSDGYKEKEERMARGEGNKWADWQTFTMPMIDDSFKGFRIEMVFEYTDPENGAFTNWYHGTVKKVVNKNTNTVQIKWNEDCLGDEDKTVTREKLMKTKWNPDKPTNGA